MLQLTICKHFNITRNRIRIPVWNSPTERQQMTTFSDTPYVHVSEIFDWDGSKSRVLFTLPKQ